MFKKEREEASNDKVNTVIGKNTFFKGSIESKGIIRLDGEMEGDISTQGNVIIGEGGSAKIDVKAKNVAIAGRLEGNIEAEGKTEIKSTGTLIGNVKTYALAIDDGAVYSGNCEMKRKDQGTADQKKKSLTKTENIENKSKDDKNENKSKDDKNENKSKDNKNENKSKDNKKSQDVSSS